jgi:hypothetical protein
MIIITARKLISSLFYTSFTIVKVPLSVQHTLQL